MPFIINLCTELALKYVVWDAKFHNKFKQNRNELIDKLNKTDIVIIDTKDNKKC
jgi:hypothetical protein